MHIDIDIEIDIDIYTYSIDVYIYNYTHVIPSERRAHSIDEWISAIADRARPALLNGGPAATASWALAWVASLEP